MELLHFCEEIPHHLPDIISQKEVLFLHVKQLETVEKDFDVVHLKCLCSGGFQVAMKV